MRRVKCCSAHDDEDPTIQVLRLLEAATALGVVSQKKVPDRPAPAESLSRSVSSNWKTSGQTAIRCEPSARFGCNAGARMAGSAS